MEKHIDKIVDVVKSTRSRKAPRYICDEVLDTNLFDQCTKFSVCKKVKCEKAKGIVQGFCSKLSKQKRLVARLHLSTHEVAFAFCMNAYLQEMDPFLNYWELVTFINRSFISIFSDCLHWTVIPVETNKQAQVILVKMRIIKISPFLL